jgi:carbon monoxide dehydrogenase subunit G
VKTTFPISAPPEAWAALADPMRLAAALPGCRSVTGDAGGDGTLQVVTEVAVAAVRGLWAGTVTPVDADAVRVQGSGAPGAVDLVVRADPERTALTVEGTVDGALGTVGSAVLAAAVRRMAEDLLAATETPGVPVTDVVDSQPDPSPEPRHPPGRRRVVAVAAVAVAIAVAIAVAGRRRWARGRAS